MDVFKIPGSLSSKYHGSGYALAATVNGQLIDLVYFEDVFPEFDGNVPMTSFVKILDDPRLAPVVRQLQALGSVHVGMCSAWEFCEL